MPVSHFLVTSNYFKNLHQHKKTRHLEGRITKEAVKKHGLRKGREKMPSGR